MFRKSGDRPLTDFRGKSKKVKGKILAYSLLTLGYCLLPFITPAAAAKKKNNYDTCVNALLAVEIPPETVALSCATVLHPEDVSKCVVDIGRRTDIMPMDALDTCRRVRRPLELATCAIDISALTQEVDTPIILDYCRRSLLPQRFSQCVVGLKNQTDLIAPQAMVVCIDAADRIGEFDPTFIPGDGGPIQPPRSPVPTSPTPRIPRT